MQDTDLTCADKLILRGVDQGKRETLKRQLTAKFGRLPARVEARIDAVDSGDELDQYGTSHVIP